MTWTTRAAKCYIIVVVVAAVVVVVATLGVS
jgi:hypothetical protein